MGYRLRLNCGFTLIEVMVGIGLAGALVLLILLLGTTAVSTDSKVSDRQIAAAVAESQLDALTQIVSIEGSPERAAFWGSPDGSYSGPGIAGSIKSNGTEYALTVELKTLRQTTGTVLGSLGNRMRQVDLQVSWWEGEKGRTGYGQLTIRRTRLLRNRMFVLSPRCRRPRLGLSLLEVMLVMGLTGIIFAITQMVIVRTIDTWWRVNANQESDQQLYRAQSSLERDLRGAAFELQSDRATLAVQKAPTELQTLAGADGDVLWFLSANDPLSGAFVRKKDGSPFWQRNVIYYAVSPTGLSALDYLGSGRQVDGYEVACPFKMLVRKEVDSGPPTSPSSDEATSCEELMSFADVAPHLNRPNGYSCAGMAGANSTVKPVSAHILTFRADLDPQLRGISIDLRCTAIERARKEAGSIADRDLSDQPSTTQLQFKTMPPNRPSP